MNPNETRTVNLMKRLINGKYLVLLSSLSVLIVTSLLVLEPTELVFGLRSGIRFTAQYSLVLFSIGFIATSLQLFPKNQLTIWIRKNRRYLGLSFAMSHLVHGLVIFALYLGYPDLFQQVVSPLSKIFGGIGFFVIFVLAMTSSDYAIKKIGFHRWKSIHRIGVYYIWFMFLASYLPRALSFPIYWLVVLFLVSCLGLRLIYSRTRLELKSNI
ncbi:MAG: ferric reductase-like transmembrane domain-containing protein [Bdellovibrionota bacterium]